VVCKTILAQNQICLLNVEDQPSRWDWTLFFENAWPVSEQAWTMESQRSKYELLLIRRHFSSPIKSQQSPGWTVLQCKPKFQHALSPVQPASTVNSIHFAYRSVAGSPQV
jgi:hypothetical protein